MRVVGVSSDKSEVNERFRQELDLPFPLVGDPEAAIISAYDVKWPILKIASRVTYIVERDRTIAAARKSARDPESHVRLACSFEPRK